MSVLDRFTAVRDKAQMPGESLWIPIWAPLLILSTVLLTGALLPTPEDTSAQIQPIYFWFYAIASIVSVLFVNPRGLLFTILSQPLFFFIGTTLVIYFFHTSRDGIGGTKLALANTAISVLDHYPYFIIPFIITIAIGLLRWAHYRTSLVNESSREFKRRRAARAGVQSEEEKTSRPAPKTAPEAMEVPRTPLPAPEPAVQGEKTRKPARPKKKKPARTGRTKPAQRVRENAPETTSAPEARPARTPRKTTAQPRVHVEPLFPRAGGSKPQAKSGEKAQKPNFTPTGAPRHRRSADLDENLTPNRRTVSDLTRRERGSRSPRNRSK